MAREKIIEINKTTEDLATELFDTALQIAEGINQVDYELGAKFGDLKITVDVKIERIEEDE